jgi:hypothetical protein
VGAIDGVEISLGVLLVVATLYDVFQSVVMPRPAVGRIRLSVTLVQNGWSVWRRVAERPRKLQTREAVLAAYAPMAVVGLLVLWGFFLILGYALIYSGLHDGLRPQPTSFGAALYFSTGRLLAFPVGGIDAVGTTAQILTGIEAASGFGLFALVISLLFSLFSSFQRRETAVVALDALAGAPPSGVQVLENCARDHMTDQLQTTFEQWRQWTVEVLESHLSYPLLFYFRSSHDNEAWPNSFGAVMDAATLVLTTVEGGPVGHARLMYKVGIHMVTDMRQYYYQFGSEAVPGVEREEFMEACGRLKLAGYRIRELDKAWEEFSGLRSKYATWLNLTTKGLAVPPAPWIGDRSYLPHRERGPRARAPGRAPQPVRKEAAAAPHRNP